MARSASSGSNLVAIRKVVAAMRAAGQLEDTDEAIVTAALKLAEVIDTPDGSIDARLWGQYQAALRALRELGPRGDDGDEVDRLIAALRGSSEVVDAKD